MLVYDIRSASSRGRSAQARPALAAVWETVGSGGERLDAHLSFVKREDFGQ